MSLVIRFRAATVYRADGEVDLFAYATLPSGEIVPLDLRPVEWFENAPDAEDEPR